MNTRFTRTRRRPLKVTALLAAATLGVVALFPAGGAVAQEGGTKPTVVLVHGAWADASSWNGVIKKLHYDGYTVRAVPNHLRTLSGDAKSVKDFLGTLSGPIVLVGHSYGGAVITNAATGNPNVKALVYVNAFAPDAGESALGLAGPDSALAADPATVFDLVPNLPPTLQTDLYLKKSVVMTSFGLGLSSEEKAVVAATQRPATLGIDEPSGTPAWRTIPSWSLIGTKDRIIPPNAQRAMAKKAGATIIEFDAGHVGLMTDPRTVTRVIERAARATAG
ncbi:alpha/beta fold hydrolase [Nonomuraea sp. NPDC050790]|uniref:alpha/beta fold hydrolase n=1 Tax=Nonomuraea sp. NPDC050790 TaxID=3364371 RepID=UPI0037928715